MVLRHVAEFRKYTCIKVYMQCSIHLLSLYPLSIRIYHTLVTLAIVFLMLILTISLSALVCQSCVLDERNLLYHTQLLASFSLLCIRRYALENLGTRIK